MLRPVVLALVIGSAVVAACGADDSDGGGMSTYIDGGALNPGTRSDGSTAPKDATPESSLDANTTPDADATAETDATADADADAQQADAGGGDPVSFCQSFLTAQYSGITVCCAVDSDAPSVQAIVGIEGFILPLCTKALAKSVADGRVAYDSAKEASCLSALQTAQAQCPAAGAGPLKSSNDCDLVYRGLVAEGGTCANDNECANGLPCQGTVCKKAATASGGDCTFAVSSDNPAIFGERTRCIAGEDCDGIVCAPPKATGETCIDDSECVTGDFCTNPPSTCEPIVKQAVGGICESNKFCSAGLTCAKADPADATGTCATRKVAGESCTDTTGTGTECLGYCKGATDAGAGTCHTFCGSN